MLPDTTIIAQTKNWITSVVVGCNFCPFAAKPMLKDSIEYIVLQDATTQHTLEALALAMEQLDQNPDIETSFLILPNHFSVFADYLNLVDVAEQLIAKLNYEGVYQLATFHPQYCFAGATNFDAANYTNRSSYPMLHLLREDSISDALENFPDPDTITERNVSFAQLKGLKYMQQLLADTMK